MKKLLCIFVIVGMLFCTVSCGVDTSSPESSTLPSPQETIMIPPDDAFALQIPTSSPSYNLPAFSSLEEYEQYFAAQGGYPHGFISYDKLKTLGEFDGFVAQSYYGKNPDYSFYHYSILHPGGIDLSVDIYPEWKSLNQFSWDIISVKSTMSESDLRTNPTQEIRGTVLIEDVLYTYLAGKLCSVTWRSGGMEICMSGDFAQFPEVSEESLIGRLLSYSTAKKAITELQELTKSGFCDYQSIYSFAQYQAAYLTSTGYSKNIVSYDDLKWLGDFKGFAASPGLPIYFLQHPSGVDITVHLYPEKDVPQAEWILQTGSVEDTLVGSDLRTISTTEDVRRLTIGNALYIYRSGKLSTIQWKLDGRVIRISADFDKLPENLEDSYLSKLLDVRYAASATDELQKMISNT